MILHIFILASLLNQHSTDRLIHRYPLAQNKMIGSALSINDGAEVLKQVYDKYYEIKLDSPKKKIQLK